MQRPTARRKSGQRWAEQRRTRIAPVARPGQLTIIGGPSDNGPGRPGWYDLSTVVRGRLHPFIRCPYHAGWCGDVLSLAWARDGTRLAFSVTSYGGTAVQRSSHRQPEDQTGLGHWFPTPDWRLRRIWSGVPTAPRSCSMRRDRSTSYPSTVFAKGAFEPALPTGPSTTPPRGLRTGGGSSSRPSGANGRRSP